jgi:hypothetical protein
MPTNNADCRFYGCHAIVSMQVLAESGGNQCALITNAYAPCRMEIEGNPPDWSKCPLNIGGGKVIFEGFNRIKL